ncbi:MAG: adenylosuccinate synthase [Phycisphaerales bacterium]
MPPSAPTPPATCTAVIGLQWGDEGKGKAVDLLAAEHDAVVRYNGGANAGHSVVVGGTRYSLHLVPSGILYPGKLAVIGNGVVVDPEKLIQEIDGLTQKGVDASGLVVSSRAHVVAPYHKAEDELREELLKSAAEAGDGETQELGTTRRGIGPAYADKVQRATAVRMGDLLKPAVLRERVALACVFKNSALAGLASRAGRPFTPFDPGPLADAMLGWGERLRPRIQDTAYLLHDLLAQNKRILFEGANATLLDVDHGTYPYVTSSSCAALGIGPGTGISERRLGRVLGVMKAYTTRVGRGPMPTELTDDTAHRIRERGREYGTTTGRPRRVGWVDLVAVRYAAMLNGITGIVLTMLDVLDGLPTLRACTAYRVNGAETGRYLPDAHDLAGAEPVFTDFNGFSADLSAMRSRADLPDAARRYLDFVEEYVGVPIQLVGVGPGREQTIHS